MAGSSFGNLFRITTWGESHGPGLGAVGPTGSYAGYSVLSKLVLSVNMLLGRLEIFPILILFVPGVWKKARN